MEAKKDNVIHFPGRKVEGAVKPQEANQSPSPQSPKRNWKSAGLLAAIIALSLLANHSSFISGNSDESTSGSRSLASVGSGDHSVEAIDRDVDWEHHLAKDLSRRDVRELASLRMGQRPTAEDQLRFGDLKGHYELSLKGGRLTEIAAGKGLSGEGLLLLEDGSKFLHKHQALMPEGFASAVLQHQEKQSDAASLSYALLNSRGEKIAQAVFGLDSSGHLLALKVSSAETLGQ